MMLGTSQRLLVPPLSVRDGRRQDLVPGSHAFMFLQSRSADLRNQVLEDAPYSLRAHLPARPLRYQQWVMGTALREDVYAALNPVDPSRPIPEGAETTEQDALAPDQPTQPDPARGVTGRRRTEMAWRREHTEDLLRYAGNWVVLEGQEIVAHGINPIDLIQQARGRGIASPYIFYVDENPRAFRLGL